MRRTVMLALALMAVAISVPVDHAAAAGATFTFYGSGYGHGVGMSQWGAYGLASQGWTHQQILGRFYSKTIVQDTLKLPKRIRVGLTKGDSSIRLNASAGSVRVWVGAPLSGTLVGSIPQGATWTVSPARTGAYEVRRANGSLVGAKRWGSSTNDLFVTYSDTHARVVVPEADQTGGSGFEYARGYFEFNTYGCSATCKERLILRLPFEQYLLGIGEVPSSWPMQALEAQVVASRTYAAFDMARDEIRPACDCHVEDGGGDQTYVGWSKESGQYGARWVAAVKATRHEVVTYQGGLIQAFFAASDGGHSESVQNVWHGGDPRYAIPYLRGVCDPGENTAANPWVSWNRSFTSADATARLLPYTGAIGKISGFANAVRGVSGRVISIEAIGAGGTAVLTGGKIESAFGLPDDRVYVDQDENILGSIRTTYDAANCKPGLPQTPIAVLPTGSFQAFQHGGIYDNAAAGLTVWVRGFTYDEYLALGGASGRLGMPVTDVVSVKAGMPGGCKGCKETGFEAGRIYVQPATGSYALWGPALDSYVGDGGPAGPLGYPTSRVQTASDGSTSATFEHGSIACTAAGSCQIS